MNNKYDSDMPLLHFTGREKNINLDHFLFSILAQLLSKMILITISGVEKIFIN
jgi:hypothetical protein